VGLPVLVHRLLDRTSIVYDGSTIPRPFLRRGGAVFSSDADFVQSGEREADRLAQLGLTTESSLLEVGCGAGRLPIGILRHIGEIARYDATDVDAEAIAWCRRHIQREHPTFRFHRVDDPNERYNPTGSTTAPLPFGDGEFDFAYAFSVFSHMRGAEMASLLGELRRVLHSEGTLFFTAFVEDGVPDEQENPPGYIREWKGPLHCVRFSRQRLDALLGGAGLVVASFDHGAEPDSQSGVVARVASTPA
jgi:SAM-dependent methyltransferase